MLSFPVRSNKQPENPTPLGRRHVLAPAALSISASRNFGSCRVLQIMDDKAASFSVGSLGSSSLEMTEIILVFEFFVAPKSRA